ncbi:MAG: DapH/DapD/GlmU-related protein [Spirochaetales bacterium]|nr:DapH/DapD/GlmU-related protein [Spirochaetales bacterium]
MKTLPQKGLIHAGSKFINSRLGIYTEVGPDNHLENTGLDDYSYTGPHCIIQNAEIGKFANIAALVRIGPTDHPMDRPTQHHFTYRRTMYGFDTKDDREFFKWREEQSLTIGHDTWIGHGAIVLSGVNIGTGAVIGAGAVVTKDIPPYAVAVGVPAKVVKYRFPEEQREALQKIAWWDWSHEKIKAAMGDFCGTMEDFIKKYGE